MPKGRPPTPPPPAPAPPPRPPDRVVDEECSCIRCGYSLRGLRASGQCPECGLPVGVSLRGDLLRWADERFITALARGLNLILTGLALYAVCLIAVVGAGVGPAPLNGWDWWPVARDAAFLGASLLTLAGYWIFSAPDPGTSEGEQPHSARRVIRAAAVAEAAFKIVSLLLTIVDVRTPGVSAAFAPGALAVLTPQEWAALLVRAADLAAFAALIYGTVLHTRWLARRTPNPALAAKARAFLWLLPTLYILGAPLCCAGPAVALVLYAGMLSDLRTDIIEILDWRERGGHYRSR